MRKKRSVILFAFVFLILSAACGSAEESGSSAVPARENVLLSPYPSSGTAVADIDGVPYLYDEIYLFRLTGAIRSDQDKDAVVAALRFELSATEGKARGLKISDEAIEEELRHRRDYLPSLLRQQEEILKAREENKDVFSEEELAELNAQYEKYDHWVELYEEAFQAVLDREQIDEDTYWATQPAYIEKYLFAMVYEQQLFERLERESSSEEEYAAYYGLKNDVYTLMEKYGVTLYDE